MGQHFYVPSNIVEKELEVSKELDPIKKPDLTPKQVIEEQILGITGRPNNFDKVVFKELWSDEAGTRFRVNVFTKTYEKDSAMPDISMVDSYFVLFNSEMGSVDQISPSPRLKFRNN